MRSPVNSLTVWQSRSQVLRCSLIGTGTALFSLFVRQTFLSRRNYSIRQREAASPPLSCGVAFRHCRSHNFTPLGFTFYWKHSLPPLNLLSLPIDQNQEAFIVRERGRPVIASAELRIRTSAKNNEESRFSCYPFKPSSGQEDEMDVGVRLGRGAPPPHLGTYLHVPWETPRSSLFLRPSSRYTEIESC